MNCYFHPDSEAVVKCPKCGVPMCRQCESKALYRADYGKGAAYCRRCSMDIFDSFLKAYHKDLSTMFIALFVTAPVVIIGLVLVISGIVDRDYFGKLLTGLLFWLICGILFSLLSKRLSSQENNQGISRFDMYDAVDRAVNPVSNLLVHMIGFTLAGPIFYLVALSDFIKKRRSFKEMVSNFETMQENSKKDPSYVEGSIPSVKTDTSVYAHILNKKQKRLLIIIAAVIFGPILFGLLVMLITEIPNWF